MTYMNEQLCLKLDDFQLNISTFFQKLRGCTDFSDVTLVSEDGHQIEAHQIILSASSTFFMNVLKNNRHNHPMIYMRGLKAKELQAIVDFTYHGEANICQKDLNNFLFLAEELQLKGLTGNDSKENVVKKTVNEHKNHTVNSMTEPKFNMEIPIKQTSLIHEDLEETFEFFSNACKTNIKNSVVSIAEPTDLKDQICSMMKRVDGKWICNVCGISKGQKGHMADHIDSNHIEASYSCDQCGKISRSRIGLRKHMKINHSIS